MRSLLTWCVLGGTVAVVLVACSNLEEDYIDRANEQANGAGGTGTGTGTTGGGGTGGTTSGGGGTGGTEPCGGTCTDPTPLCDENTNTCVECLGPSDCGGATPACNAAGTCVQCTPTDDAECTGANPYCDPATFACAPCSYHEHCPDSACNVFTGECLNAVPVLIGSGEPIATIALAFQSVGAGEEAVFLVKDGTYNENPAPPNLTNRTVALLGNGGRPVIRADDGNNSLTVAGGATLLLADLDVVGNTFTALGLQASGRVVLDAVKVTSNNGGGVSANNTAELIIRTSFVAATTNDVDAISLGGATLSLRSSSVAGSFNSAAVSCTSGHDLTIRNSILFNRDAGPTLDACGNAVISYSAGDEVLPGNNNVQSTIDASLFAGLSSGDLLLTPAGVTTFTDVALWQTGDPATDIRGNPRPTTDGTPDVCGADEGP